MANAKEQTKVTSGARERHDLRGSDSLPRADQDEALPYAEGFARGASVRYWYGGPRAIHRERSCRDTAQDACTADIRATHHRSSRQQNCPRRRARHRAYARPGIDDHHRSELAAREHIITDRDRLVRQGIGTLIDAPHNARIRRRGGPFQQARA